ncbi:unnamed protein product [Arctogadus glacialis]
MTTRPPPRKKHGHQKRALLHLVCPLAAVIQQCWTEEAAAYDSTKRIQKTEAGWSQEKVSHRYEPEQLYDPTNPCPLQGLKH